MNEFLGLEAKIVKNEFLRIIDNWAALESRVFAAKAEPEGDALALPLSSIEDGILRLQPMTKTGAPGTAPVCCRSSREGRDDGLLYGALRHALYTLSRST